MKKPSARRQKLREKALAEYLTVPPEERAKRNREFVRKMRGETQAWDDFQTQHLDGVMAHYAHAREKHPYFCDWIGACQAWSGLSPIIVDEYEIRSKSGRLTPARFGVRILDWKGSITTYPIDKGELYRVLHDYIRYVAVGARQDSIKKGLMKLPESLGKPQPFSGGNPAGDNKQNNKGKKTTNIDDLTIKEKRNDWRNFRHNIERLVLRGRTFNMPADNFRYVCVPWRVCPIPKNPRMV